MAYATPSTYTTGQVVTAAEYNKAINNTIWAGSLKLNNTVLSTYANSSEINVAVSAKAYNSAAISIADITWTSLTFDSESWDTTSIHSTSSNTDRFTLPLAGYWLCMFAVQWANNTTGFRSMRVTVGGVQQSEIYRINLAALAHHQNHSWVVKVAASDILRFQVYQNSGGAINVTNASEYGISGHVTYLGA